MRGTRGSPARDRGLNRSVENLVAPVREPEFARKEEAILVERSPPVKPEFPQKNDSFGLEFGSRTW